MELGKLKHHRLEPYFNERRHQGTLFIGKPQTGKTTALTRIALDDITAGQPVVFFGDTILPLIPEESSRRVSVVRPEWGSPFPLNAFVNIKEDRYVQFADTFLSTIKGIWGYGDTTPTMDMYFRIGVLTLLLEGRSSLASLHRLIIDPEFRATVIGRVDDQVIKEFWQAFDDLDDRTKRQDTSSTLNKLYAFLLDRTLRQSIAHKSNQLEFDKRIVIIDLSQLGSESAKLFGALILTQLYIEGLDGLYTNLFVDDAEPYAAVLEKILAECREVNTQFALRKYIPLADSAGTIVAFRTSVRDAALIEPEFGITGNEDHLYELPPFEANVAQNGTYERLMMQGCHPLEKIRR